MSRWGFDGLLGLEWLETNGLGGYASGTYSGANSRRYHGILVAALHPPVDRQVVLSKLDESLRVGQARYALADNCFPDGVPKNAENSVSDFGRDLFPFVEFSVGGARLRKSVALVHGENTTLLRYELLSGPDNVILELKPFLAPRGMHDLGHANAALRWDFDFDVDQGLLRLQPYDSGPKVFVQVPGSAFLGAPAWYYRFQYRRELERGLDFEEDLFTYGRFETALCVGLPLFVLVSTDFTKARDGGILWDTEVKRRLDLFGPRNDHPTLRTRLRQAADQFLVRRGTDPGTVIAGYPWFEDWGRDTMISLRGLCLSTGRFEEARNILSAFLGLMDQGMLPNRCTEAGTAPQYNSVDATLWLFVAVHDYFKKAADTGFVFRTCLPALLDSLAWHRRGTRFGIHVAEDGLLSAGEAGLQLTWMDAKVGDLVVTPRQGKPVEVNALWYNALRITEELCRAAGQVEQAQTVAGEADALRLAFEKSFWNEASGCCYDVLGADAPDASIRPNQIFCLSLPYALFEGEKASLLLQSVTDELLTPRGLRSLSPRDARYAARYEGSVAKRDGAYHQGTVWAWLLGPYIDALVRVEGEAGKRKAREILASFEPHLDEACVGTVSEIFDAEAPHTPRGCYAQAWSVAELLRVGLDL